VDSLRGFVEHFTYLGIFAVLLLASLGVPIPEEMPIIASAVLSHEELVRWWLALPVCVAGVLSGDTVTGGSTAVTGCTLWRRTSLSGDALFDEQHRHFLDPPKIAIIGQEDVRPRLKRRRQLDRIGGSQPVPRPERGGTIGDG
jgi:hypothetical protein